MPTVANSSTIDYNRQVMCFILFFFMNFDNYFFLYKQRFVKRTNRNMNCLYFWCILVLNNTNTRFERRLISDFIKT